MTFLITLTRPRDCPGISNFHPREIPTSEETNFGWVTLRDVLGTSANHSLFQLGYSMSLSVVWYVWSIKESIMFLLHCSCGYSQRPPWLLYGMVQRDLPHAYTFIMALVPVAFILLLNLTGHQRKILLNDATDIIRRIPQGSTWPAVLSSVRVGHFACNYSQIILNLLYQRRYQNIQPYDAKTVVSVESLEYIGKWQHGLRNDHRQAWNWQDREGTPSLSLYGRERILWCNILRTVQGCSSIPMLKSSFRGAASAYSASLPACEWSVSFPAGSLLSFNLPSSRADAMTASSQIIGGYAYSSCGYFKG